METGGARCPTLEDLLAGRLLVWKSRGCEFRPLESGCELRPVVLVMDKDLLRDDDLERWSLLVSSLWRDL
jgi:hypothetical protein